jgi:hypothetical protein
VAAALACKGGGPVECRSNSSLLGKGAGYRKQRGRQRRGDRTAQVVGRNVRALFHVTQRNRRPPWAISLLNRKSETRDRKSPGLDAPHRRRQATLVGLDSGLPATAGPPDWASRRTAGSDPLRTLRPSSFKMLGFCLGRLRRYKCVEVIGRLAERSPR